MELRKSTRASTIVLSLLVVGYLPASSQAKVSRLVVKGEVFGSAYHSGKQAVIPVILPHSHQRRAKLTTPVLTFYIPQTSRLRAPGGSILPRELKAGDRFQTTVTIPRSQRKAIYPRVKAKAASFKVTKRSPAIGTNQEGLSNSELTRIVQELRKDLDALKEALKLLSEKVAKDFNTMSGEITTLHKEMNSTKSETATLHTQFKEADAKLSLARSDLQDKIDAVSGDTTEIKSQLQTQLDKITDLETTEEAVDKRLTAAKTDTATLTKHLNDLATTVHHLDTTVTAVDNRLVTAESHVAGLAPGQLSVALTSLSTAQADLADLHSRITHIDERMTTTEGSLTTFNGTMSGLISTTVPALLTEITGLQGSVTNLNTASSDIQSQITTVSNNATATSSALSEIQGDLSGLSGIITTLQTTVNALGTTVNGQTGLVHDVNGLCGLTIVGISLGTVC